MSGEDDTFDIDIYGDENENQQAGQNDNPDDHIDFDDDADLGYTGENSKPQDGAQSTTKGPSESAQLDHNQIKSETSQPPQQGIKRKAEDDHEYNDSYQNHQLSQQYSEDIDPSATPALKLSDLHWWTTEEDLRAFCAAANVEDRLRDLSFGEHKINGKSRGEAYLEFSDAAAADAVKKQIEKKEGEEAKRANPFHVYFSAVSNPFKGRDSGAQGKKDFGAQQHGGRGGAYNQNFASRGGGFRGRGGSGFDRGGSYNNRGGFQQQQQNGGGWNAGGMGGFGGANPMMSNPMMMGMAGAMGYNNMGNVGRGGMMGGRGGFGMGNMPNMGMAGMGMGGRGAMGGMGGRGGFGGGFQQGMAQGYGGGGYGVQGGQPNKRMKEG